MPGCLKRTRNLKNELAECKKMLALTQNDSTQRMEETRRLKKKVQAISKAVFRYSNLKRNEKMFKFYTGIEDGVFKWILKFGPKYKVSNVLNPDDHLLLVLVKLWMGLTNRDLGYRFQISQPIVTRILQKWLPEMS